MHTVLLCFALLWLYNRSLWIHMKYFIHIHQGCFAGTEAIVTLPQCQWSKPDGYGKISQCITTTKHSKARTVCIFLGIYCIYRSKPDHSCVCKRAILAKKVHIFRLHSLAINGSASRRLDGVIRNCGRDIVKCRGTQGVKDWNCRG